MKISRFWTFTKDEWDPGRLQRWGLPHRGGDEWGRRVVTVGFWFLGYVNWVWRTCWCKDCHDMRAQTYGFLAEEVAAFERGQHELTHPGEVIPASPELVALGDELARQARRSEPPEDTEDFGPVPEPPRDHTDLYEELNPDVVAELRDAMPQPHVIEVGTVALVGQEAELPETLTSQMTRWADLKARMKAEYEAEQARIAAMPPEERAEHEAAKERKKAFFDALAEMGDDIVDNMTGLRLADPRVAESHGGGACPEQHEGVLTTGEHFYFRYRHGWASLTLGDRPGVYGPPTRYVNSPGFIAEQGMEVGDGLQGIFDDDEQRNSTFSTLLDRLGR